ncbi:protein-tyrosine phosphatase family protein [Cytophagaceae bacterium YF14B1]|uniref:Protein-tyrosine phosphatase family protein n=1 Tax=Xanthocytophaga flava TaxID=3048013 RepID=A0AAE3UB72_9BACT|nr:protein-tyrosine phosphatase family protein [Xanthocytophaga flavus]MDJ1484098.1 protein-tyrosine phosphatase family protein [Xanthocytophaga flavus]
MFTRIYWIETIHTGSIGIMPRPRGNEDLESEILYLAKQDVKMLVCLLMPSEIRELGLQKEKELCEKHQISFLHFPIPDRSLPDSLQQVYQLINQVEQTCLEGKKVVFHCRGGIGRVTLMAGAILRKTGLASEDIIKKISQIRGLQVPDTEEQAEWLRRFK